MENFGLNRETQKQCFILNKYRPIEVQQLIEFVPIHLLQSTDTFLGLLFVFF